MFQNIKVDIIYFDTSTDFELEFNLSGCCRMRLLTDKTDDNKNFLHMLARGVSRSRVILVIGKLFGDNSIINLSAQAIGKNLSTIDNKMFGIDSEQEIQIISNSTPLVSSEGYFGGCIIESGPQTMILLTDNKNIRKNIMNNLIHPYISELSILEMKENTENSQTDKVEENISEPVETVLENNQAENTEVEITESQIDIEGNMKFTEYEVNGEEYVLENDEYIPANEVPDIEIEHDFYIEPDKENYQENNNESNEVDDYIFDEIDDFKKQNTPKNFEVDGIISVITVIILLMIGVLCFTVFFIPISKGSSPAKFINDIFSALFSK